MRRLLLLFFVLLLSGCASLKLVPVEDGLVVDKEKYTSLYKGEDLEVLVKAQAWKYSPSDLTSYVLPLYVELKNLSKEKITVERKDVYLIDDMGEQYNALSPSEVSSMLSSGGVGLSFGFAYYSSPFWFGWYPYYPYYPRSYPDIVNYAFVFGSVEPNSTLRGFIYFQKLREGVKKVRLRINYKVGDELKSIDFPFEVKK